MKAFEVMATLNNQKDKESDQQSRHCLSALHTPLQKVYKML